MYKMPLMCDLFWFYFFSQQFHLQIFCNQIGEKEGKVMYQIISWCICTKFDLDFCSFLSISYSSENFTEEENVNQEVVFPDDQTDNPFDTQTIAPINGMKDQIEFDMIDRHG